MLEFLLQGITIGFSAGITPGPLLALLIGKASRNGWKKTLPAAFAPILSDIPIIFIVLVLLSQTPDWLINFLRIAGGVFLLYLAWNGFQKLDKPLKINSSNHSRPDYSILRSAVAINLLNPNPYIFWGTVLGPVLIAGWREQPLFGISYVTGFYSVMITVFMLWILIFGTVGQINPLTSKILGLFGGTGMAGFGIWQLLVGFRLV